jgi:hypothetical protein
LSLEPRIRSAERKLSEACPRESLGNQTPDMGKTTHDQSDAIRTLSWQDATGHHWLDKRQLIPKPCVAGSSPAGGAEQMPMDTSQRYPRG